MLRTATVLLVSLPSGANAQLAIAEVIKAGVKKVIKAVETVMLDTNDKEQTS